MNLDLLTLDDDTIAWRLRLADPDTSWEAARSQRHITTSASSSTPSAAWRPADSAGITDKPTDG